MGQKRNFRHLIETISDICYGVAEVDFSANQVQILHNALRPDEVGASFDYDTYVLQHLPDLGNEQEIFADLLTRQELLDSLASGQTSIDINAHVCTIKVKFFTKDRDGNPIYFSSRSPRHVSSSTVPYNNGNDDIWVGSVGGNGASVSLRSTAGFANMQARPDLNQREGGAHETWNGVERRGVKKAPGADLAGGSGSFAGRAPQDGSFFLAQHLASGSRGAARSDKTDVPAAYAVPETDPTAKNSDKHQGRAKLDAAQDNSLTSGSWSVPPGAQAPRVEATSHEVHVAAPGEFDYSWLETAHVFVSGTRTKVSISGLDLPKIVAHSPIFAHFIVLRSASNNILQQITTAFVFANCDYFIYIDPRKGSALMFVGSQSGTPLPPRYTNDYNAESIRYAQRFVVPEDRIALIRDMELNHVIEMLRHQDAYITYCGVQDPIRGYTRKRLEFRYTDDERKMISLVRTDITEIYELERFHSMKLQEALDLAYSDPLTSVLNKHGFTTKTSALLTDLELQCRRCRSGSQQLRSETAQHQDFALSASAFLRAQAQDPNIGDVARDAPRMGSRLDPEGQPVIDSSLYGRSSGAATARPNPALMLSPATCMGNDCTFAGALLFIDLDNFKPVNDTYGHMVGDELLIKVASLIRSCVRTTDLVGRYGGDEFVVYLLCIGRKSTACSIAQRICDGIAALRYRSQGEQINISCSVGLAMAPYDGFTYDDLVTVADHRLYLAKSQGKGKVVASSYDMLLLSPEDYQTSPEQDQILAQFYPYCASCADRGYCQVATTMLQKHKSIPVHICHD